MTLVLRRIQIGITATIALFFSLIGINNIVDYASNWPFVQHVLSMDTTFHDPALMWRAITNPTLQRYAYAFIIAWEILTALLCWAGCIILFTKTKEPILIFNKAKSIAFIGLFLGFLLYMVGFFIIGCEWFSMWQSQAWNGQTEAVLFIALIMLAMLFLVVST